MEIIKHGEQTTPEEENPQNPTPVLEETPTSETSATTEPAKEEHDDGRDQLEKQEPGILPTGDMPTKDQGAVPYILDGAEAVDPEAQHG